MNINSIRNKFDQLNCLVKDRVDILVIFESKLDDTFPQGQFFMDWYRAPFRKDRNGYGGGILVYIREDIPCKEITAFTPSPVPRDIEAIFIEINLRRTKWLFAGCYRPSDQSQTYFYEEMSKSLDFFSKSYESCHFNSQDTETVTLDFLNSHEANNIVKDATCFKNPSNPSCVDLFITNKPKSFQLTQTMNTVFLIATRRL